MICIYLSVPYLTNAQNLPQSTLDSSIQLTATKQYNQAALLLEKLIYKYRTDTLAPKAVLLLAKNYQVQQQYAMAILAFAENRDIAMKSNMLYNYYLQWSLTYLLNESYEECLLKTQEIVSYFPDSAFTPDVLLLRIMAYNGKADWTSAKPLYHTFVQRFALPADTSALLKQYATLPKLKNAEKAKSLSAYLPLTGAGLFYAGRWDAAVINIILQAGFLYFGIHQFLAHEYVSGALIGVGMYASFYNGSGRYAAHLVEQRNRKTKAVFNSEVALHMTQVMQSRVNQKPDQ